MTTSTVSFSQAPEVAKDGQRCDHPLVTIVIPCLNEAGSIASCVSHAVAAFQSEGITGEVLVADNGSTDGSVEIAQIKGARVVPAAIKGYGAALRTGIQAARGEFIILGDADG